jgi:transcriptional regulator with XRE-family HTH domain
MERHSMRAIREVLRLRYEAGLSHREISAATGLSKGSVSEYLSRAKGAGVTWPEASEMSNVALEQRLFNRAGFNVPATRAAIDFPWVHRELRRTGVTLQLLWVEYQESVNARGGGLRAYQYSQFCDLYAAWRAKLEPTMRQVHRAPVTQNPPRSPVGRCAAFNRNVTRLPIRYERAPGVEGRL